MTFRDFYNKLLNDPYFGRITHRHAQHKAGYIEGMKRAKEFVDGFYDKNYTSMEIAKDIEQAIAEESK